MTLLDVFNISKEEWIQASDSTATTIGSFKQQLIRNYSIKSDEAASILTQLICEGIIDLSGDRHLTKGTPYSD